MPEDKEKLEKGLGELRRKVDGLDGELTEDEALDVLEEAVAEVESLGERLEEGGS
ncbi:MAG: hypothetical protein JW854_17160 [Actinobacteria bacterium]|nr:hypothetical protein [Actinomycetota bacterium]